MKFFHPVASGLLLLALVGRCLVPQTLLAQDSPVVSLTNSGASLLLSWPQYPNGFVLQKNTNLLNSAAWLPPGGTIALKSGMKSLAVSPPAGSLFFRLSYLPLVFNPTNIVVSTPTYGAGFSVTASGFTVPEGGWIKSVAWDVNNDGVNDIIVNRSDTNGDGVINGSDAEPGHTLTMNWAQMGGYAGLRYVGQHVIRLTVIDSYNNTTWNTVTLTVQ
jgi:hypothetical protein